MNFLSAVGLLLMMTATDGSADLAVPLLVREHLGRARRAVPVVGGVPVGPFRVRRADQLGLFDAAGSPVPCQVLPLVRGSDGTLKWVLVDFRTDLAPGEVRRFRLRRTTGRRPAMPQPMRLVQQDHTITVLTGPLKVAISKRRFDLFDQVWLDRDGDGRFGDDEAMLAPPDEHPPPSS